MISSIRKEQLELRYTLNKCAQDFIHLAFWSLISKDHLRKRIRDFFSRTMQRRTVARARHSRLSFFFLLLFIACLPPCSDATQVNIAVTNNNVNTIVNSDTSVHTLKPGQHVCKRERVVEVPVKQPQTYIRPIYQRFKEPCLSSISGYCTVLKVVYQRAVRHVVHLEPRHQIMYSCCPGWSKINQEENDCLKPICDVGCKNGGDCMAPNKCRCPPEWTGEFCENDVDECAAQTDKCQQICINQDGAYTCGCHQGFSLQSDGRTCSLCLACSPEFKQMQVDYKQLHRRVLRLEREKSQIRKNVTKLKRSLRRCIRNKCKRQPATTTNEPTSTTTTTETTTRATTTKATQPATTKTTQPTTITTPKTVPTTTEPDNIKTTTVPITDKSLKSIEYMISSMNKQFDIIEERLDECTCQGNSRLGPREPYYHPIS